MTSPTFPSRPTYYSSTFWKDREVEEQFIREADVNSENWKQFRKMRAKDIRDDQIRFAFRKRDKAFIREMMLGKET